MTDKIVFLLKKIKEHRIIFSLAFIFLVGIFLRVYCFSDWLIFNSDQARDAAAVRDMVEKKEIPLLGPVAGGTGFKMGPIGYYFSYISARMFGVAPEKMAYPDLLWGILTIPVLFFIFKEFFSQKISLSLTGLYSVAYYSVYYSRFAWNPNSAQFFCPLLILCFLKILNSEKKAVWTILAGFSLGVAVQLHTLLLAGMPLFFLAITAYSIKKRALRISQSLIIIAIAILLNIPQIANEVKTKGGNFIQFKSAVVSKKNIQSSLWKNALDVASCQIQSNAKILMPSENNEECVYPFSGKYLKKIDEKNKDFADWLVYSAKLILILSLSLTGYFLLAYLFRKEKNEKKRNFLITIILFNGILFLVFIPFGAEISLRYFTGLAFIPFILMGLIIMGIIEKFQTKNIQAIIFLAIAILFSYNLYFNFRAFKNYSDYSSGSLINGTRKQIEEIALYMVEDSASFKTFQVKSSQKFDDRFFNRISYFFPKKENDIVNIDAGDEMINEAPLFFAIDKNHEKWENGKVEKYGNLEEYRRFGKITVFKINPGI